MSIYMCGLLLSKDIVIPASPDGQPSIYVTVPFPYGNQVDHPDGWETSDSWQMHKPEQPNGDVIADWYADRRSGLIYPYCEGWATLQYMVQMDKPGKYRSRLTRDPFGAVDTTATEDHDQYQTNFWQIHVDPTIGYAVQIRNRTTEDRKLIHAQFKLSINTDIQYGPY